MSRLTSFYNDPDLFLRFFFFIKPDKNACVAPFPFSAKIVISIILSAFKRPINHTDPALACAHVMLLARAPIKSYSDTQINIMMLDILDNVRQICMYM